MTKECADHRKQPSGTRSSSNDKLSRATCDLLCADTSVRTVKQDSDFAVGVSFSVFCESSCEASLGTDVEHQFGRRSIERAAPCWEGTGSERVNGKGVDPER